jgi:hypothetical protein
VLRTSKTKSKAKISAVFPLIDRKRILREACDITFANDSITLSIAQLIRVSAFWWRYECGNSQFQARRAPAQKLIGIGATFLNVALIATALIGK